MWKSAKSLSAILVLVAAFVAPVFAFSPAVNTAVIYQSTPSWVLPGNPTAQIDFSEKRAKQNSRYYYNENDIKSLFGSFVSPAHYVVGKDGVLYSVPSNSLDCFYVPTGSCRGQLIERASTNLSSYSNSPANWTTVNQLTLAANNAIAPDGALAATKVTQTTANSYHGLINNCTVVNAFEYVGSHYVKMGTHRYVQLFIGGPPSSANAYANFDLQTGTFGTVGADITVKATALADGWYRIEGKITTTATGSNLAFGLILVSGPTAARAESYVGSASNYIYHFGAQFELGAFASSYIPTLASTVTRSATSIIALDGSPLATALQQAKSWYFKTQGVKATTAYLFEFAGGADARFNSATQVRVRNGSNAPLADFGSGSTAGIANVAFGTDATSMTAVVNGGTFSENANAWAGNTGNIHIAKRTNDTFHLNGYLTTLGVQGITKGVYDTLAVAP